MSNWSRKPYGFKVGPIAVLAPSAQHRRPQTKRPQPGRGDETRGRPRPIPPAAQPRPWPALRAFLLDAMITLASKRYTILAYNGTLDSRYPNGLSSLTRKPVIATPTPPTPLRTFYIDQINGLDANSGAIGAPFQTLTKADSIAQAGDCFYFVGDYTGTDVERIGKSTASGTSANPIQWRGYDTVNRPTVVAGGGANGYPTVSLIGSRNYHWLQDLILLKASGTDQSHAIRVSSSSTGNKFVRVGMRDAGFAFLGAPDNEIWEMDCTGDHGTKSSNSGDWGNISNSSHRCKVMKSTFSGTSGHSAMMIGNVQDGATQVDDVEIFDTYFSNTWAGGLQPVGFSNNTHIHWCVFENMGTDANPLDYSRGSQDGLQLAGSYATVEFNTFVGNTRGMLVSHYFFGAKEQKPIGSKIRHNVFTRNLNHGLYLHAGPTADARTGLCNMEIENNVIWGNALAGPVYGAGYYEGQYTPLWVDMFNAGTPWDTGSLAGNKFRNNLIGVNTSDPKIIFIVKLTGEGNKRYTAAELAALDTADSTGNLMATDPLMVNAAGGDYHLQAASPCIEAGLTIAGIDYLGTTADIGKYEYGGTD